MSSKPKSFFNWGRNIRINPKQIKPKNLFDLKKAVSKAHKYVNKAILNAPDIGEGNGPLNHLVKM